MVSTPSPQFYFFLRLFVCACFPEHLESVAVANLADIPARQCTVHGLAAGLAPFEMDFDKAHVDT